MASNNPDLGTGDQGTAQGASKAILVVVCIALFFSVINASAVGVVLPEIAQDFSMDSGQLSWLMTGFLLIFGIAIPFYGRLADRYGARPLFLIGVGIFSVGSILSAVAPNYEFLLVARIVQAVGGAGVPGLGMTLASRAYGPEARGMILGVIAATIGVAGAVGPLVGGVLSELMGWRSIFFITATAALTIPTSLKLLPHQEERTGGSLDQIGGVALGLAVAGVLLVPSEGARSGWTSPLVITGFAMAAAGLAVLTMRQLTASSPFIPKELLANNRYVGLLGMSFSVMGANLAPLVGLPVLLSITRQLSPLEIGLVMVPGALMSAGFGILSGKLTDRTGPRLPVWAGGPMMLLAVLGLSSYPTSSLWVIATFGGLLGAGFGMINTPLAATVSRIVRGQMLASALSINSMLFFLGASFGTAVFMALADPGRGASLTALNPLHSGAAAGFSDGFLVLAVPVLAALGLSLVLPRPEAKTEVAEPEAAPTVARVDRNWTPTCSVPWHPECEEFADYGTEDRELVAEAR